MVNTIIDGKTCLEKRGFVERHRLIAENIYNGKDDAHEYSSRHENAKSTPNSLYPYNMKGKGTGRGGHTDYQGYYGEPNLNFNHIDYSNFITISDETNTVGNKIDIETRKNLSLKRRYNRGINEYSSQNIDAISNGGIIGKGTNLYLDTFNGGGGYDIMSRESHLMRNEWKRDLQYTKLLVDAEYLIQTEFKVSSYEDKLMEQEDIRLRNEAERNKTKIEKLQSKKEKIDEKIANLEKTASDRKYPKR